MITIDNKTWTEQELVKLVYDSRLIAEFINMDLETIKENDDVMAYDTYKKFSEQYFKDEQ